MAFDRNFFDPQPSTKGIANTAVYETTDNLATVNGAGYFNLIADNLQPNAFIKVVASDGVREFFVTTAAGAVTIVSELVFA